MIFNFRWVASPCIAHRHQIALTYKFVFDCKAFFILLDNTDHKKRFLPFCVVASLLPHANGNEVTNKAPVLFWVYEL